MTFRRTKASEDGTQGGFTQVTRRSCHQPNFQSGKSDEGSSAYWAKSGTPTGQQCWWQSQSSQAGGARPANQTKVRTQSQNNRYQPQNTNYKKPTTPMTTNKNSTNNW